MEREDKLTLRPYCSYCFLLSQATDSAGLEFLRGYSHEIDQITAEAIAFLVLVDQIDTNGSFRPNPRWADQSPRADLGVDLGATYDIFEDESTRFGDESCWTSRWRLSGRRSVEFARACGVAIDELPCLVVFDAAELRGSKGGDSVLPAGLVVSLKGNPSRTYEMLRSACARFYGTFSDVDLLQAVRNWDTATSELEGFSRQISEVQRVEGSLRSGEIPDLAYLPNTIDLDGRAFDSMRPTIDAIQEVTAFATKTHQALSELKGWKAMKTVDREEVLSDLEPDLAHACNGLSCREHMPEIMSRLRRLDAMASTKHRKLWGQIEGLVAEVAEKSIEELRLQHSDVSDQRAVLAGEIANVDRPRFQPFLEREMKRDRRDMRKTTLRHKAAGTSEWLRSVLDAITTVGSQFPG